MDQQSLEADFEKQINNHEPIIFKVCRMYAFTSADREDLYQEIILQAWKSFERFRGEARFSTWLYRVAINTAITGIQQRSRRIDTSALENSHELNVADAASTEDPQLHDLYAAIAKLNDVEKAIVMLYLDDFSYDDMEGVLGISEGTLRVKMNRIRQKLKQITHHS